MVQWQSGKAIRIPIGVDGFFLGEMPLANPEPGATGNATVRIVDGDGFVIASRDFGRFISD